MNSSGHIVLTECPIGQTIPFYQVPITYQNLLLKRHKLPGVFLNPSGLQVILPPELPCFPITDTSNTIMSNRSHDISCGQGLGLPQHPIMLQDLLCAGSLCFTQYLDQRKISNCGISWLHTLKRPIDIMLHLFYQ